MINKIINKVFYNPYKFVNKYKSLIFIGNSILTKQFRIRFTGNSKPCVKIMDNCILGCNIVFEKNSGNVYIGNNVYIGEGTKLISINNISIGDNVQISWGVTIYDHNGYSLDYKQRRIEYKKIFENYNTNNMLKDFNWDIVKSSPILIENDVWIGFGVTILKGVTIGEGAIISAGSVVINDVKPFAVVMGNPAKEVKVLDNVK